MAIRLAFWWRGSGEKIISHNMFIAHDLWNLEFPRHLPHEEAVARDPVADPLSIRYPQT